MTKTIKEEQDYYIFKERVAGWVTISRHEFPDFCANMTRKERNKHYKVKKVWI